MHQPIEVAPAIWLKVSVAGSYFTVRLRPLQELSDADARSMARYCAWIRHGAARRIPYWQVNVLGSPMRG